MLRMSNCGRSISISTHRPRPSVFPWPRPDGEAHRPAWMRGRGQPNLSSSSPPMTSSRPVLSRVMRSIGARSQFQPKNRDEQDSQQNRREQQAACPLEQTRNRHAGIKLCLSSNDATGRVNSGAARCSRGRPGTGSHSDTLPSPPPPPLRARRDPADSLFGPALAAAFAAPSNTRRAATAADARALVSARNRPGCPSRLRTPGPGFDCPSRGFHPGVFRACAVDPCPPLFVRRAAAMPDPSCRPSDQAEPAWTRVAVAPAFRSKLAGRNTDQVARTPHPSGAAAEAGTPACSSAARPARADGEFICPLGQIDRYLRFHRAGAATPPPPPPLRKSCNVPPAPPPPLGEIDPVGPALSPTPELHPSAPTVSSTADSPDCRRRSLIVNRPRALS